MNKLFIWNGSNLVGWMEFPATTMHEIEHKVIQDEDGVIYVFWTISQGHLNYQKAGAVFKIKTFDLRHDIPKE